MPGRIIMIDLVRHVRVRDADAFALICRHIPLYWPMLALLRIPAVCRKVAHDIDPDAAEDCAAAGGVAHPTS